MFKVSNAGAKLGEGTEEDAWLRHQPCHCWQQSKSIKNKEPLKVKKNIKKTKNHSAKPTLSLLATK